MTARPFIGEEHFYSFLYEPHTVTALLATLAVVLYVAFLRPQDNEQETTKLGLFAVVCVFLVYAVTQIRDSLMIRPHPAVWRLIHGLSIVYLLALVYILCQRVDNARATIRFFYPEIQPLPPASNTKVYAEDCRIRTPGHPGGEYAIVRDTVWDRFMLAHLFGWWGKTVMVRSWTLAWILCIMWELLEYSFQHILVNFHECW